MKEIARFSPASPARFKGILVASAAALAALALTGCGSIDLGSKFDKSVTHEFDTGAVGKEQEVLPRWVPDSATNIKEVVRSTGNERIIRMSYSGALPDNCQALKDQGAPSPTELIAALRTENASTTTDHAETVKQQYQTPLLTADWWTTGQEAKTTHLCGKWWVSQEDGTLNAYTPETKNIAEGIVKERSRTT